MTSRRHWLDLLTPPAPVSACTGPAVPELPEMAFWASWWAARTAWPGVLSHQLAAQPEQESTPAFRGTPGHPQELAAQTAASVWPQP